MRTGSRLTYRLAPWLFVSILSVLTGRALAQVPAAPAPDGSAAEIEPEAMDVLIHSAEFLAKTQQFSFVSHLAFDVRQDSGQLLEFGARRATEVRRPDRLRTEVQTRNGDRTLVLFDGKVITLLDQDENVYATAPHAGTIDDMLDFTLKELETPVPLAEILSSRFPERLRDRIRSIYSLGEETLDGTPCDHLAARGDEVDVQFWVATGAEPLLRRVVLTYKQAEGQPQFRADLGDWLLGPAAAGKPDDFEFKPPAGAEAIPFLLHSRQTAPSTAPKGDSR
jgi:hypothetical protein